MVVYSDELCHHGILGMKWGIRRYQNPDGTLTVKGRARYAKVASSERLQKRDTREAKRIYRKNMNEHSTYASGYENVKNRQLNKYDKLIAKSIKAREKGDNVKAQKYDANASAILRKVQQNMSMAAQSIYAAEWNSKKIQDIDSGKIKAGRDFIVQRDYNAYVLPFAVYVTRESKIVNKDGTYNTEANLFKPKIKR